MAFSKSVAVALGMCLTYISANAEGQSTLPIQLYNIHTRKTLVIQPGRIPAPSVLNRFLRCSKDRKYTLMDPRLIVAAVGAAAAFGMEQVNIVSAFRTQRLNRALAAEGHNVALRSRHINGQALDLRIPHVSVEELCQYFRNLRLGGVGCYPGSNFVHIDVGPVRTWDG